MVCIINHVPLSWVNSHMFNFWCIWPDEFMVNEPPWVNNVFVPSIFIFSHPSITIIVSEVHLRGETVEHLPVLLSEDCGERWGTRWTGVERANPETEIFILNLVFRRYSFYSFFLVFYIKSKVVYDACLLYGCEYECMLEWGGLIVLSESWMVVCLLKSFWSRVYEWCPVMPKPLELA